MATEEYTNDKDYRDFVDGLVEQIRALNHQAFIEYKPMVDDICSRVASQNEAEHLLDYLLDFAGDDRILRLYKRVCRSYWQIYPESIAFYIMEYRKNFEEEDIEPDENEGDK